MEERTKKSYRRNHRINSILVWTAGILFVLVILWLKYLEATGQRF